MLAKASPRCRAVQPELAASKSTDHPRAAVWPPSVTFGRLQSARTSYRLLREESARHGRGPTAPSKAAKAARRRSESSFRIKLQGSFRTRTKAKEKEKANGRVQISHMRASKLLNRQHFRSNPSLAAAICSSE